MSHIQTAKDSPSASPICSACSVCDVHFYLRRHVIPDDTMAMAKQAVADREYLLRQVKALKAEVDGRIWLAGTPEGGETPIVVHNHGD